MATRAQKIRLAVFFVVAGGVLTAFLFFVAGSHLLRKRDFYRIEFEGISVGGLSEGAQVKYQGITVGRVEDTYISADHLATVVVEISVEPNKVPNAIRTNTQARIFYLGITGLKYIELIAGTEDAPPLPPGSKIQSSETFLSNIEERADILTEKIEQALNNVNLLLNAENRGQFTRLLANTGDLMENASLLVHENRPSIREATTNLALMSQSLAHIAANLQATTDSLHHLLTGETLQHTVTDLQVATHQMRQQMDGPLPELIANLNVMVANMNNTFTRVDQTVGASRGNILRAMQDLEETLQNIRETTEVIRDNPAVLIRGGGRTGVQE